MSLIIGKFYAFRILCGVDATIWKIRYEQQHSILERKDPTI